MGTPDFAVSSLEGLIGAGHTVSLVVTREDKPKGRGQQMSISDVKACAITHNIPVYQPRTLRDGEARERIARENPDVIVVVAYGRILPKDILELPPLGCVNVHASLLPRHRGAAPIQWTILSGDLSVSAYIERSGVSGVVSGKIMTDGSGELLCVMEYLESSGPSGNETATETATETDTETAGESGTVGETDSETETVPPGEDYLKLYGIDVRIGDVILSSGAGAVYPAGLRIGKVREVRVDSYSRKLTLVIEPAAELGKDLTYALILTETGSGS